MSQARTGETPYTQHRHLGATGLRAKKRAIASSTVIGSDLSADLKQENIDSKEPLVLPRAFSKFANASLW